MATDPSPGVGQPPAQSATSPPSSASGRHVEMAALSHTGRVRPNNEDVYIVAQGDRALRISDTNLPAGTFSEITAELCHGFLVADGIGGMAGGEIASRKAVTTLIQLVLETPDWVMLQGQVEGRRILDRMTERFRHVDELLRTEAMNKPELAGMGTTMTLAVIVGTELLIGHVGDSRAYLCRGDIFDQLTRDHTTSQELADAGFIPAREEPTHRYRNSLTRALGGRGNQSHPDLHRLDLRDGDQVLLCSDGLSDSVSSDEMASVLRKSGTAKDACRALVDLALDYGGVDNVTAGVARCHFPTGAAKGSPT